MDKMMLMSVIFFTIFFPIFAAQKKNVRRWLQITVLSTIIFNILYMVMILFIYPRLFAG